MKFAREDNIAPKFALQETSEVVGWILRGFTTCRQVSATTVRTGYLRWFDCRHSRLLVSQDRHEVFLTFAKFLPDYLQYLDNFRPRPGQRRHILSYLRAFGPWNTLWRTKQYLFHRHQGIQNPYPCKACGPVIQAKTSPSRQIRILALSVMESGWSESSSKLRDDASWFLTESAGDVKVVFTISIQPKQVKTKDRAITALATYAIRQAGIQRASREATPDTQIRSTAGEQRRSAKIADPLS
jgi:hypothetical protein